MKRKTIGILLSALLASLLLSGCEPFDLEALKKDPEQIEKEEQKKLSKKNGSSKQEGHAETDCEFANELVEKIDPAILRCSSANYSDYYMTNQICFDIVPANAEGVDVEMYTLFAAANQLLSQDKYKECPVTIYVQTQHYDVHAHIIVAYFSNTKEKSGVGEDHLWSLVAHGLQYGWENYDENYDYTINHKSYWEGFTGLREVSISEEMSE